MHVVVVGAGLGGLAAACHLAGRGHDVTVLERGTEPGGRAGVLRRDGFAFDTGPTVFTMPALAADAIRAAGVDPDEVLAIRPVDPMYRACYSDGTVLHVRHGREAMAEEIRAVCGPDEAAAFHRFADWLTGLYELELPHFIDTNFDSVFDLAKPPWPALRLVLKGGFRRLASVVGDFFLDERLRRIFSFQAMYAGLAPYEALAVYAVITYMDSIEGVYHPVGGMHALPRALATAATRAGAEIRYGAAVTRIRRSRGRAGPVVGVELAGGEFVAADAVVANPDLPVAYRTLLGMDPPRKARKGHYSPSCVVWHAGLRGRPPEGAAHHNIHFGEDWDGAFRALLHDGVRMPDPSVLVTLHSMDEPDLAPPDGYTVYALEPVPNLDGRIDWTTERERVRDDLAARVASLGYTGDLVTDAFVDPLDWERDGMERGTPFALSHRFFQTGPFRPGNVDDRVPGLVLVGSGTVPGVGVPMVLLSGHLAAERVDAWDARRSRPTGGWRRPARRKGGASGGDGGPRP